MNRTSNEGRSLIRWPFCRSYQFEHATTTRVVKDTLTGKEREITDRDLQMSITEFDQMEADRRGRKIIVCLGIGVVLSLIVIGSLYLNEYLNNKE